LVYYEVFDLAVAAIARGKQIKGGSRQDKVDMVTRANPEWRHLFDEL
jgi:putative endonuclease